MSRTLRRFEVLLPLRFNDGTPVPDDAIAETQTIRGQWRYESQSCRDDLVRVFVDVADEPGSRHFFVEYKETLKSRFRQLDIWMTTDLIEVL